MIMFDTVRESLKDQFKNPSFITDSGLDEASLKEGYNRLMDELKMHRSP